MPSADYVEIRSENGGLRLLARLGQETPQFSGGVGGWEPVPRPGRRAITVWRGITEPLKLTLPILFDRLMEKDEGETIESECRTLERMGGLERGDPEPPQLIIDGALPYDATRSEHNRWVIDSLEWGDAIRRWADGHRVRQAVTITLLAYEEDDALGRLKAGKKPKHAFYKARKGDTYTKISSRVLKAGRFGNQLARLNGKKSGAQKIKAGTSVRLPSADALTAWKRGK